MCLTFGMTARDIMLAQYAKASDPSSGGRQMPGHYGDRRHNLLSVSSPVATQILHAVGIALAAKIRGTGQVALAAMGEGSSNQGDVHEALNFAGDPPAAVRVPGREQRLRHQRAGGHAGVGARRRDAGGGLRHPRRGGRRLGRAGLLRAARTAVELARAGDGGPTLIEAKVTRLTGHSSDDQQTKYRTEEELAAEKGRDALPRFRDQLRDAGVLTEAIEASLAEELTALVHDATEFAEAEPDPEPSTAMRWVYAEDWPSEAAVGPRRREPRLMALMTFIEAIRDTLAEEMRRDESVIVLGEDVGKKGGVPGHGRAVGRVRRPPGDRHAVDRVDDRRGVDRGRRERPPAGGRDPVRRLHPPGVQPARVRGGPDALSARTTPSACR